MMTRCSKNVFLVNFDIQQKRFQFSFFQKLNQIVKNVCIANFNCDISTKKVFRIIVIVFQIHDRFAQYRDDELSVEKL